jgi:hypothetical protein
VPEIVEILRVHGKTADEPLLEALREYVEEEDGFL